LARYFAAGPSYFDLKLTAETLCIDLENAHPLTLTMWEEVQYDSDKIWDDSKCKVCDPPCPVDTICDYMGGGMCMCGENNGLGGPSCEPLKEMWISEDDFEMDIMEPYEGISVEVMKLPLRRDVGGSYHSQSAEAYAVVLYNKTKDDFSVSKFVQDILPSSTVWNSDEDGEIEFLFTVERLENRKNISEIRIGLEIDPKYRYPDISIRQNTFGLIRVHPFGGFIDFVSSATISESSDDDDDDEENCALYLKRTGGSGGNTSVRIDFVDPSTSDQCRQSLQNHEAGTFESEFDTSLSTLEVFWSDGDDSEKCVELTPIDDDVVEGVKIFCASLVIMNGSSAKLSDESITTLVTLLDDDQERMRPSQTDDMMTTLLTVLSVCVVAVGIACFVFRYRDRREKKSWIPIRRAIHSKDCSEEQLLQILNDEFSTSSADVRVTKTFEKTSSSFEAKKSSAVHNNKEFTTSWFFLLTHSDKKCCVRAVSTFLTQHKKYVKVLSELRDADGRKAINICGRVLKNIFESHLLFLKRYVLFLTPICHILHTHTHTHRYRIDDTVVHRSATCEVVYAVDVKQKSIRFPDGAKVCLKLMKHFDQFEKEISMRSTLGNMSDVVISILGYHVPEKEMKQSFTSSPLLFSERTEEKSTYPYILVMHRAENSAFHAILTQRVAGIDALDCSNFARNMYVFSLLPYSTILFTSSSSYTHTHT